jgi:diguanylate cyclase (GGDEF)-like protein
VPALPVEDVRFAFQPLINLVTGGITAVEALPRGNVPELVPETRHQRRLRELDWWLAVSALRAAAATETRLPVHINVLATALAHDRGGIDWLRTSVEEIGRQARNVTVEVGPPFDPREFADLVAGIQRLRAHGFGIALEEVGDAALPLTLIADIRPDLVKLAPEIVRRLVQRSDHLAVLESVRHLCRAMEADLLAPGVDNEQQLTMLRRNGVRMVQGNLLARPARRPPTTLRVPGIAVDTAGPVAPTSAAGPRVTEFLTPATLLPQDVVADVVRQVFTDQPDISGVVLVDAHNRPQWTVDRNRFLLAVTGPYGYALHAKRPAARLADQPLLVSTTTTAMEALHLLADGERRRSYDDAVVVDEAGHCLGVVQASNLIRGMTELKAEQAAALNPLTRLPGSDSVANEVAQRIAHGCEFAVGWLDIDDFKKVNDTAGFSAGDSVIRGVGRSLADAAATLGSVRVAHVGGDDFLLVADPAELPSLAAMVLDQPRRVDDLTISLSLATLICAPGTVANYDDVSRRLAPLKRRAKATPGSSWVQSRPGTHWVETLRGAQGNREPTTGSAAGQRTQQRAAPARQIS